MIEVDLDNPDNKEQNKINALSQTNVVEMY